MPEIIPENGRLLAQDSSWQLEFDAPQKGMFHLKAGSTLSFSTLPAELNQLPESAALPGRRKIHASGDGMESELETVSSIPFGAEPSIRRKYLLSERRLHVTTDFLIRNSMMLEKIDGGGFAVSGNIRKIELLEQPRKSCRPAVLKEAENGKEDPVLYCSTCPPLLIRITGEDGTTLEFSAGEDLWRWDHASELGGKSEFRLERKDGILRASWLFFERTALPDQEPVPGRNWRFTYLLAWRTGEQKKEMFRKFRSEFDLRKEKWQENALCMTPDGKRQKNAPCPTANAVNNVLKQWVRSTLADLKKNDRLLLKNVCPCICSDAAHQKRAGKKVLKHFTLPALLEFRRWAEKQLAQKGAVLVIRPEEDSPFADSPVFRN